MSKRTFRGIMGKTLLALLFLGVPLLVLFPFLGQATQERAFAQTPAPTSSSFDQESLLTIEKNSLLPANTLPFSEELITKRVRVMVTAYSSSPWETDSDPHITASGSWVRDGIVASNLLPFGAKIRIPEIFGPKIFTVEDRMSAKKGEYHIDVWVSSYQEALEFGAHETFIDIIERE